MSRFSSLLAASAVVVFSASPVLAARGTDGTVNIVFWQAASTMNPYLATAPKELAPLSLVLEPLAGYDEKGTLFPRLAQGIPTVENGGVSNDFKSITWKLKSNVKWSDGTAVTANDVVFTGKYCMDPKAGCAQLSQFDGVNTIEAIDDLTVRINFKGPTPVPYGPFVSGLSPIIQARQFSDCTGEKVPTCTDANFHPIGTGPFVITSFKPNDAIQFKANPNYRDPEKPHFSNVNWKGGGDSLAAARAVLQTGEYDYGWNLQLPPEVLRKMQAAGKGTVLVDFGPVVEALWLNMTDPSPDLPADERSTAKHSHPILSDVRVRKAMSMALDRPTLSRIGYDFMGRPACDVIVEPKNFAANNTSCLKQDIAGAKTLLDEAGWNVGPDGIRRRDGKKLKLSFVTSTNAVRQQFQSIIKQWWHEVGIDVELRNVSASVLFGGDPGSPDTFQKFYADVLMYTFNSLVEPGTVISRYTCDSAPRPANQWQGSNSTRYCDKNYDGLVAELSHTASLEKRGEIIRTLNNMLTVNSDTILPLVWRGNVDAASNTLEGVVLNSWENNTGMWNAQDWSRKKQH